MEGVEPVEHVGGRGTGRWMGATEGRYADGRSAVEEEEEEEEVEDRAMHAEWGTMRQHIRRSVPIEPSGSLRFSARKGAAARAQWWREQQSRVGQHIYDF
jgi:hypothetical protein